MAKFLRLEFSGICLCLQLGACDSPSDPQFAPSMFIMLEVSTAVPVGVEKASNPTHLHPGVSIRLLSAFLASGHGRPDE